MIRFILGMIAGGIAVMYCGDQLLELAAKKSRNVRKGAADTLQAMDDKAGNVLDMAKEQVSSGLQSGQEANHPSPTPTRGASHAHVRERRQNGQCRNAGAYAA